MNKCWRLRRGLDPNVDNGSPLKRQMIIETMRMGDIIQRDNRFTREHTQCHGGIGGKRDHTKVREKRLVWQRGRPEKCAKRGEKGLWVDNK